MRYTDDPIKDFENWDYEQSKMLDRLPTCDHCGEKILDDFYYLINDDIVCADCLDRFFKMDVVLNENISGM